MAARDGAPAADAGTHTIAAWKLDCSVAESVRDSQRTDVVSEYAEHLEDLPPVTVYCDTGAGVTYLADGAHTLAAFIAKHGADVEVPCVLHNGDREAALLHALKANIRHGIRESRADRQAKVRAALQQWPNASSRDIADKCGVSHPTVESVRRALEKFSNGQSQPAMRTCRGEFQRQYPAKRKALDASPDDQPQAPSSESLPTKRPAPFVDRFDEYFGKLIRFLDEAASHFEQLYCPQHKRALEGMEIVLQAYAAMRQRAVA